MLLAKQKIKEDPRITRTRAALIGALGELMQEKNFDAITVGEIAERAAVNRVTFYAHFQDKHDLLEAYTREMIRKQVAVALPQRNPFSEAKLASLMRLVCGFLTEFVSHCPPPHGQLEPLIEKQIKIELYEVILGWLKSSPGSQSPSMLEQVATVTTWAMYGAAAQWSQRTDREPVADFVWQVLPMIKINLPIFTTTKRSRQTSKQAPAGGTGATSLLRLFQLSYQN